MVLPCRAVPCRAALRDTTIDAASFTSIRLVSGAGVSWGIYSVRGKGAGNSTRVTVGNFIRTVPIAAVLSLALLNDASLDLAGFWYAVASGSLTSALGYVLWYTVVPMISSTSAATMQLSVPVIIAIGGVVLLAEPITLRLLLASAAVLGGIGLVINAASWPRRRARTSR